MENRYHRAAKDGYLDALKSVSKKECNQGDEDGMTPTLWAAFEGNLETLRFLIGKGGDPEKTDYFGNTSLHLSAAKGHMEIATFLVNFGVNVWALDIDLHTARELAGMNGQAEVLAYLDSIHTQLESESPSKVKKMKDKAEKAAQKLLKNYRKCQIRNVMSSSPTEDEYIKVDGPSKKKTSNHLPLTYSEMTGTLSMERKPPVPSSLILKKLQRYNKVSSSWNQDNSQFKIRSKEDDGTLKITNLSGYRRDSEIIFVAPPATHTEVPSIESKSPAKQTPRRKEIAGIFERPGFGSVAFRNSMSASLFSFPMTTLEEGSIGSAGSFAERIDFDESSLEEEVPEGPRELEEIDVLLASLSLSEFSSLFHREKVDLEALYLLSEDDLKSMNIPIGPRRKLLKAICERKDDIHHSIVIEDSSL